ncbi:MAG: hypothetical protein ISP90_14085 [Nevskia sp.]|nr:hypothetical protein [Nevskia sp.]
MSVVVAMTASYAALDLAGRVATSERRGVRWWLVGGAAAMGIWSMHFIGMIAVKMPIQLGYDPLLTLASLLIAVVTRRISRRGHPRLPELLHHLWPQLERGAWGQRAVHCRMPDALHHPLYANDVRARLVTHRGGAQGTRRLQRGRAGGVEPLSLEPSDRQQLVQEQRW